MLETWRPIPTWPKYEVSDLGRVRNSVTSVVLRGETTRLGYKRVILFRRETRRRRRRFQVHRLVLLAFTGRPPRGKPHCNHKNGVPSDNRLVNLEWVSPRENIIHAIDVLGKKPQQGSAHGRSKLTENQVNEIRHLRDAGRTLASIAAQFGICYSMVGYISRRCNWTHI